MGHYTRIWLLLVISCIVASVSGGTSAQDTKAAPVFVDYDPVQPPLRIIYDLMRFDLAEIAADTRGTWVVGRTEPGNVTVLPNNQAEISGLLRVRAIVNRAAHPADIHYRFPVAQSINGNGLDDVALINGRIAALVFEQKAALVFCAGKYDPDTDKIPPVYRIPEGWEAFVKPAYQFFTGHRALFDPEKVSEHKEVLGKLLAGPNPILALHACRTLALGRSLPADFYSGLLAKNKGYLQSALLSLAVTIQDRDTPDDLPNTRRRVQADLVQLVLAAPSAEHLCGLVDGLMVIRTRCGYFVKMCRPLYTQVDQRRSGFGTRTPYDTYLAGFFQMWNKIDPRD